MGMLTKHVCINEIVIKADANDLDHLRNLLRDISFYDDMAREAGLSGEILQTPGIIYTHGFDENGYLRMETHTPYEAKNEFWETVLANLFDEDFSYNCRSKEPWSGYYEAYGDDIDELFPETVVAVVNVQDRERYIEKGVPIAQVSPDGYVQHTARHIRRLLRVLLNTKEKSTDALFGMFGSWMSRERFSPRDDIRFYQEGRTYSLRTKKRIPQEKWR